MVVKAELGAGVKVVGRFQITTQARWGSKSHGTGNPCHRGHKAQGKETKGYVCCMWQGRG